MSLPSQVDKFNTNVDRVVQFVNGNMKATVQTDGGPIPSLSKLVADSQALVHDAVLDQLDLKPALAAAGGAALVGTAGGGTVQSDLDQIVQQVQTSGKVKTVAGTAPDAHGDVALTTNQVTEGDAKYFTEDRTRGTKLTNLSTAVNAVVAATDTVLAGIGKLQRQISDLVAAAVTYANGKINFKNAAGSITSFLTNANTAARTYTFPDKDGTVAMTSDVQSGSYVLLASQLITAAVANIDFTSVFTDAYDKYVIEVINVMPSGADTLCMRMFEGATLNAGNFYRANGNSATVTYMSLMGPVSAAGNGNPGGSLTIEVLAPRSASLVGVQYSRPIYAHGGYQASGTNAFTVVNTGTGYASPSSNSAPTGFRLYWQNGSNFAVQSSNTPSAIRVYGIKAN